jgi:hypothetical protein
MSPRVHFLPSLLLIALLAGSVPAFAARSHAHLRVMPNPVVLHQRFTVKLTGAKPHEALAFLATPSREGFGGGNMGTHRANAAGTISFRYGPFKKKLDVGHWTVTVVRKGAGAVTVSGFNVIAKPKAKKKSHKK